ncbi:hypothetical protein GCM10007887_04770 [Methylobacterium haplocladii]|uniref:HNH nuclease domain-containing protein n=1 Tax=Methylobacterium haplocladii TaxID=1176176 RepID=A0A512IS54_9HYPH|nr:hypothetical protein MHA02_29080 [Methylobacterium haplocladii]GLS57821.1 hypothetical protein GCM10007887_04770 [Methylobacterium haplocladii]
MPRSKLSGKTNSSARFCSRPCYERHLCRTDRKTGRGSQWAKVRKEALRLTPYCWLCGTTKRLQVHHIIPWRLTFDNRQPNLAVLCTRHHKVVEMALVETEKFGFGPVERFAWRSMLAERRDATRMMLLEVWRELEGPRMGDRPTG